MHQKKSLRLYLLLSLFTGVFNVSAPLAQAASDTGKDVIKLASGSEISFDEFVALASEKNCDAISEIMRSAEANDWNLFALRYVMADKPRLACIVPYFYDLMSSEEQAQNMRAHYLGSLDNIEDALIYEHSLSVFTRDGLRCLQPDEVLKVENPARLPEGFPDGWEPQGWLADLCREIVHRGGLVALDTPDGYRFKPLAFLRNAYRPEWVEPAWLLKLIRTLDLAPQHDALSLETLFEESGAGIYLASWWQDERHRKSVIHLELGIERPASSSLFAPVDWIERRSDARVLLVLSPEGYSIAAVPTRFGTGTDNEVVRVTDIDTDGNLEIWWGDNSRKCEGNNSDLELNVDCSTRVAELGEIRDNVLTFFTASPAVEMKPATQLHETMQAAVAGLDLPTYALGRKDRPCNLLLLGSIMKEELDISYRMRFDGGDVIDVVCKSHPLHSDRTIVALFHNVDADIDSADPEYDAAFTIAVVDVGEKALHGLHRSIVRGDAITRFGEFSLELDTARYYLTDRVRALGVRMNINDYPRYAESGESQYLSLFIEGDDRLKPVLSNLPMHLWRAIDLRKEGASVESADLILKMSETKTEGWRDIEVIARYDREEKSLRSLGKLRAANQKYSFEELNLPEEIW